MAGEIIRLGDRTSHGGTVLEGSLLDICMGKPIAFMGHKTFCPLCKGAFPIIEGVMTMTFYGRGVAIAGMKTACGASLIASQFTDLVEIGGGAFRSPAAPGKIPANQPAHAPGVDDGATAEVDETVQIECFHSLTDESGNPVEGYCYDLFVDGQLRTQSSKYSAGDTTVVPGFNETHVVAWIERDSAGKIR